MSSRLVGAVLALTAAALLATSIATSALWSGPPTVTTESGPRTIDKKTVNVGLFGAHGCNTGGDGKCQSVALAGAFPVVGYAALGTQALLLLLLLALAGMSFSKKDSRRSIAKFALVVAIVAAAAIGALVAIGPAFKDGHISVPIGYGMFLFAGSVVATIIASVLAPKDDPPPTLRPSRSPSQPRIPTPPPAPEFNVEDFFAPEPAPQRPSNPSYPPPFAGTPPPLYAPIPDGGMGPTGFAPNGPMNPIGPSAPTMMGNGPAPIPGTNPRPFGPPPIASPGGMLPGPAGPLGASSAPMFGEQPNFSPPQFPPGFGARPEGDPSSIPPGPRTKTTSVVPPPRAKPASIAPSIPGLPAGPRPKPPSLAPPPFKVPTIPPFVAAGSAPGAGPALPGLPPPLTPPPEENTDAEAQALRPATNTGMGVNETTDMSATPISDEDPGATLQTPPVDRESASDLAETTARPKMDPEELEATNDISKTAAAFKAANAAANAAAPASADEAVTTPRRDPTPAPRRDSTPAPRRDSKPAIDDDPDALAKIPVTTASENLPPPKEEKAAPGPQPACPQCEAPMSWVEEHLRFYCKSCRMYF